MALADIIAKLLELLGLKKTESKNYEAMEQKLRATKATNVDRLEGLKEQIGVLERKVKVKKKEYDAAAGDTRRIIGGEIERLFVELDRLQNRETILGGNIDKVGLAIAKVSEMRDAQAQGLDEEMLDDIAVELEDIFAELKVTDRAATGLEKTTYEARKEEKVDIESRMADLESQTASVPQATETTETTESAEAAESVEALSKATLDRLKNLADEEG